MPETLCHCGKPLHYRSPAIKRAMEEQVAELGERVIVKIGERSWLVPRHYIALHGIKGWEVAELGFEEVKREGV